jgi:hypothetical protein
MTDFTTMTASEIANLLDNPHLVDLQYVSPLFKRAAELLRASDRSSVAPVRELSDAEIVKVLASLGIDADKSKYGFPELQVHTTVPAIRQIVARYLAALDHPSSAGDNK